MKQKLLRISLISCLLVTSLIFGGAAYAQDEELPDPGLTPDSPFYFLDRWGKNLGMFFAFSEEAKARKALQYAEERLAEARAMADRNKVREMELAANDYEGFMNMVRERLEAAERYGISENITERVSLAISHHLDVLDRIKDRLPEQAQAALTRARTAGMNGQINALRELARTRTVRALDIAEDAIENRLERARVRATDNITADVQEALDYASRIAELEVEITALAEEKGIDITAITERLAQATTNRLEVLSDVYEAVPESARQGIANAIENSVRKYERVVEKLATANVTTDIPDAETIINRLQQEVREILAQYTDNTTDESENNRTENQITVEDQEQIRNREMTNGTATQQVDAQTSANQTDNQEQKQKRSP